MNIPQKIPFVERSGNSHREDRGIQGAKKRIPENNLRDVFDTTCRVTAGCSGQWAIWNLLLEKLLRHSLANFHQHTQLMQNSRTSSWLAGPGHIHLFAGTQVRSNHDALLSAGHFPPA